MAPPTTLSASLSHISSSVATDFNETVNDHNKEIQTPQLENQEDHTQLLNFQYPPIERTPSAVSRIASDSGCHPHLSRHSLTSTKDNPSDEQHSDQSIDDDSFDIWIVDTDVDNATAVARLSADFDLMFENKDDEQISIDQHSVLTVTPTRCCAQSNNNFEDCSNRLGYICFSLSVITFVSSLLLAIQTVTVQQFGCSILCLVGSLVFLFLIILQKRPGTKSGTALGSILASFSVASLCLLIFAVWSRDLVLLFSDHDVATSVHRQSFADVVEAKLFPNVQPQLWGCFPSEVKPFEDESGSAQSASPILINDLSLCCLIGQCILGFLSLTSSLSSIGVGCLSIWICLRLLKQHREQLNNTKTLYPTRLQRTVSTPLTETFSNTRRFIEIAA